MQQSGIVGQEVGWKEKVMERCSTSSVKCPRCAQHPINKVSWAQLADRGFTGADLNDLDNE